MSQMNTVIMIDEEDSVYVSTEITIDIMTKPKQQKKSSKDNNVDRILTIFKGVASKKRYSIALQDDVRLIGYADGISKKLT